MDDQQKTELRKLARIDEPLQENIAANPSGFLRDLREITAAWKGDKRGVEAMVKKFSREDPKKSKIVGEFILDILDAIEGDEPEEIPSVRRGVQGM